MLFSRGGFIGGYQSWLNNDIKLWSKGEKLYFVFLIGLCWSHYHFSQLLFTNLRFLSRTWSHGHWFLSIYAHRPYRGLDLTVVHCRHRLNWANAHIWWRLTHWRSHGCVPVFHCSGQMTDSVCDPVWVSGLLMCVVDRGHIVVVGFC